MSLNLEIVSRQRRALGEKGVMSFGQDGGTIGRSLATDWPLPDSKRYLSSRHAIIDFHSGSYYIIDTSKNGVFINGAEEPVGHGKPQRLFPGDRIRIGEYEISVAIENADDTRESLMSTDHVDPVEIRQRVESPEPTSYDLVDAHAITGVGIEMVLEDDEADLPGPLRDTQRPGGGKSSRKETASPAPPPTPLSLVPDPVPPKQTATGQNHTSADPLAAFFRGAGMEPPALDSKQTEQMLMQLGRVTRELVAGAIDCLHLRALQKARLMQSNTMIQAKENNRLKFSANVEEGLQRLFVDESDEYAGPAESVRAAFADIKTHQRAFESAMCKALDEYLERLEPGKIESRTTHGRGGLLINAANKHRHWDLYKDVYAILANRPVDELPQAFVDALAKHYEQETSTTERREPAAKQEAG